MAVMLKSCETCMWYYKGHCACGRSRWCTEERDWIDCCGCWEEG